MIGARFLPWKRIAAAALAAAMLAGPHAAPAQYPARTVRIVVPFAPGNAPDLLARLLGEQLAPVLGQAVTIEHKPGSNGNLAAALVAQSAADGHTLLLAQDSLIVANPHLYRSMPVDVRQELVPVATLASNVFVLAVNPSLPIRDLREFIEFARRARPPLAYGSGGNGSQHHLMMEELKRVAGIELVHVPYRSGVPATAAAVAGEVAVIFAGASAAGQLRAGKLRALAVTSAGRSAMSPELPAIAEHYPGYEMTVWLGLFAPAGTPPPVLERLRGEVARILAAPEMARRMSSAGGLQPLLTSPEEFAALIRRDDARYRDLIRRAGVELD